MRLKPDVRYVPGHIAADHGVGLRYLPPPRLLELKRIRQIGRVRITVSQGS
jgi:hypothetical protein